MSRAKPGQVQIRYTLLEVEGLSSRLAVNKESIQYEFMTRVIPCMKKMARIRTNDIRLFLLACKGYSYNVVNRDFNIVLNLFT
jgi:hypothetical protein